MRILPFALLLAMPGLAWAHDDYQWIAQEPSFVGAGGVHCCSKDCSRVDGAFASPMPGGWRVNATGQEFRWGEPGLYPSRDGIEMWACRSYNGVRCLFVPASAS